MYVRTCMYVCILYVVCMYDDCMYVVIMWGHHSWGILRVLAHIVTVVNRECSILTK